MAKSKPLTSTEKARRRVDELNQLARQWGYPTWRVYETAKLKEYRAKATQPRPQGAV